MLITYLHLKEFQNFLNFCYDIISFTEKISKTIKCYSLRTKYIYHICLLQLTFSDVWQQFWWLNTSIFDRGMIRSLLNRNVGKCSHWKKLYSEFTLLKEIFQDKNIKTKNSFIDIL